MTTSTAPGTADVPPQFGVLMRRHRLRIGLTQRELADLSTISVRAIRDLEQGRATRPRSDTVRLIADGLRLGPRARADLESAAHQGRRSAALHERFTAAPPSQNRATSAIPATISTAPKARQPFSPCCVMPNQPKWSIASDIRILAVMVRPANAPAPTLFTNNKPATTATAPTSPPNGAHHGIALMPSRVGNGRG